MNSNNLKINKFFAVVLFSVLFAQASAKADVFTISSPDFKNGASLAKKNEFSGFGCGQAVLGPYDICASDGNRFDGLNCNGQNIAPTIHWNNPPEKTRSFAFTVYDPDAPNDGGWWHFIVYNIARDIREISGNKIPQGAIAVTNDGGTKYYMGPCPPAGDKAHRYIFTIYALDTNLDLPATATTGLASYMINRHKLASASIFATYQR